jgi:hypothetical protein
LENNINLLIEEGSEMSNEDIGNNNISGIPISVKMQIAIRLTRPARYK